MKLLKKSFCVTIILSFLFVTSAGIIETPVEDFSPAATVAALGDSITQAANACEPWQECPEISWATGLKEPKKSILPEYSEDGIESVAANISHMYGGSGKDITVFNNARSNATSEDLEDQARLTVSQNAEFITILSGGNDICVANETSIISDTDFRENISNALQILKNGLPKAKILYVSIPNIYNLWEISHNNPIAVAKWTDAQLCQSMLANPLSEEKSDVNRRERVLNRIVGFNKIIEEECSKTAGCLFDNNRLFNTNFTEEELSPVDYFHPSLAGQKRIVASVWTPEIINHALVSRGIITRSSPDAPLVEIVSPKNNEIVYGEKYKAVVKVKSKSKIERVYADTQLGSIDLIFDKEHNYWFLTLDTTLAPDGINTFFTVVAIDENNETTVTEKISVTVNNSYYNWEDFVREKGENSLTPSPAPSEK